jgi:hypothetical protein
MLSSYLGIPLDNSLFCPMVCSGDPEEMLRSLGHAARTEEEAREIAGGTQGES